MKKLKILKIVLLFFIAILVFSKITTFGKTVEEVKNGEKDYLNGKSEFIPITSFSISDMHISGLKFVNPNEYFVYGSINVENFYESQEESEFPVVMFYSYNELVWKKIINLGRYAKFTDGTVTDSGIALIGTMDASGTKTDVITYELDFSGRIILEKKFTGSELDFGYRVFSDKNYLYLVMASNSSDFVYQRATSDNEIIIVKIKRTNSSACDYFVLGNHDDDIFKDAIMVNGKLYIYMRFVGRGYYNSQYTYRDGFDAIVSINERFELEYDISVEYLNKTVLDYYKIKKLMSIGEDIILASTTNDTDEIDFYIYDNYLEMKKELTLKLGLKGYIIDYCSNKQDDTILLAVSILENNLQGSQAVVEIDDEYKIRFSGVKKTPESKVYRKLTIFRSPSGELRYADLHLEDSKISITAFKNYKLMITITETIDSIVTTKDMLFNGIRLNKILESSNLPSDNFNFGVYEKIYQINSLDQEVNNFSVVDEYVFKARANVFENQIYDKAISLTFNGKAYLNNQEIELNHQVKEVGYYILKLESNKGETKLIPFEIAVLSEEDSQLVASETNVFNLEMIRERERNVQTEGVVNVHLGKFEESSKTNLKIIVSTVTITLGIFITFLVRKTIIRRKNNV